MLERCLAFGGGSSGASAVAGVKKKTTEIRSVRGRFSPRPRHPARQRRNSDSPRSAPLLSPQLSGRKVLMAAATARSLSICCGVTPFFQSHLAPADSDGKSAVLFQFLLPKRHLIDGRFCCQELMNDKLDVCELLQF